MLLIRVRPKKEIEQNAQRLLNSASHWKGDLEGAAGLVEKALILDQEILILALTPAGTLTSAS